MKPPMDAAQIEDIEAHLIVGADITSAQAIMYARHLVLKEREACAKAADEVADWYAEKGALKAKWAAKDVAATIRERS